MSELFDVLEGTDAAEAEASRGNSALYKSVIAGFLGTGNRSARIVVEGEGANSNFRGMKAQNVKTGLDSARKAEGAPDEAKNLRISQRKGKVFLVNTAVEA